MSGGILPLMVGMAMSGGMSLIRPRYVFKETGEVRSPMIGEYYKDLNGNIQRACMKMRSNVRIAIETVVTPTEAPDA